MTPEQRFEYIEALLQRTAEEQGEISRQQAEHSRQIDKQNDAIRGLAAAARTCLDSIREMREEHSAAYKELLEAQAATGEKLNILINTVDRIIRNSKQ